MPGTVTGPTARSPPTPPATSPAFPSGPTTTATTTTTAAATARGAAARWCSPSTSARRHDGPEGVDPLGAVACFAGEIRGSAINAVFPKGTTASKWWHSSPVAFVRSRTLSRRAGDVGRDPHVSISVAEPDSLTPPGSASTPVLGANAFPDFPAITDGRPERGSTG